MSEVVLDASAMLAFLNEEPGSEVVASYLDKAAMSTINLSEVVAKLTERDTPRSSDPRVCRAVAGQHCGI